MKVLLSWLKDYVDTDLSAEQIAELLSDLGLPNEGIEYLNDDAVIDLEITSNRGDCLGYIGVARELAAATGSNLKIPQVKLVESEKKADELVSIRIDEPELCGRYTARIIEDVKVGPSPQWLRHRLEAVGLRSVNNVVDATNYAMLETGQPPHAFDYHKISDHQIIVRKAIPGEQIVSIDGSKCDLDPDMLVIADTKGPVAIAGVMGGLHTEVSDDTTCILLEDAHFNPLSIRTTSRRLALPSEAAFRFERIVDIENIDWASQRTCQLIVQVAGGKIARGAVDIYPAKWHSKNVKLRLSRLNKLLGMEIPAETAIEILKRLCFEPVRENDGVLSCTVPSWRNDVYREVDLIEEVARVYGYSKLPIKNKIEIEVAPLDERQKLIEQIGRHLNGCGFYEAITVGFIDAKVAEFFSSQSAEYLTVKDESRKSSNILRQALIGSLLGAMKLNFNMKNRPCRLFEIANTFIPKPERGTLPIEKTKLALVCDSNFRDIRGVIETLAGEIARNSSIEFRPAQLAWAEAAAQIFIDGDLLGIAGLVSYDVKKHFDLEQASVCAAELDFETLANHKSQAIQVKPIPRFPAIERDLSLIIDENIRWSQIIAVIDGLKIAELERIDFVDIYRGKTIPQGKKSITLTLRFRDEDGTLRHETVDKFQQNILDKLSAEIGAQLRAM